MKVTRVFSDAEAHTHFEDFDIPLKDGGIIGRLSEHFPVKDIIFRETTPDYDYDWHRAPQRQFILLMDGEIEIETSLGEKRRFSGGDILLVEDVSGRGHRTRALNEQMRRSVFVTLP